MRHGQSRPSVARALGARLAFSALLLSSSSYSSAAIAGLPAGADAVGAPFLLSPAPQGDSGRQEDVSTTSMVFMSGSRKKTARRPDLDMV